MKINKFCIGIESLDPNYRSFEKQLTLQSYVANESLNLCHQAGGFALESNDDDVVHRAFTEIVKEYNATTVHTALPKHTSRISGSFRNEREALESVLNSVEDGMDIISNISSYNHHDILNNAAFGLENIFDPEMDKFVIDTITRKGRYGYGIESNDGNKKGYIARFIDFIKRIATRIKDYLVSRYNAFKERFRPVAKEEASVANKVDDVGMNVDDMADFLHKAAKEAMGGDSFAYKDVKKPAILDIEHLEKLLNSKLGGFLKSIKENNFAGYVLTEPDKTLNIIKSVNYAVPSIMAIQDGVLAATMALIETENTAVVSAHNRLEKAINSFMKDIVGSFNKKGSYTETLDAAFTDISALVAKKYDKNEYSLGAAVEVIKEINKIHSSKYIDDITKSINNLNNNIKSKDEVVATVSKNVEQELNKLNALIMDCVVFMQKYLVIYCSFLSSSQIIHKHISKINELFEEIIQEIPKTAENQGAINKLRDKLGI